MKEKRKLEDKPPGICEKCFEDPESRMSAPSGLEVVYCSHGQVLGFKLQSTLQKAGWQLHWPVPADMMDELVRGSLQDVLTKFLEKPDLEH